MMKHYSITQWADYARGLVDAAGREAMQAHLNNGCASCLSEAVLFERLARVARAEARYQVPEPAAHCAKAIFVLQRPESVFLLPGLRTRLVFDSFFEPIQAGVRSQQRLSRRTLYEAGDYSLDLRQEHERGSRQISLIGQITSRAHPERLVPGIPIRLASGSAVVAQAVSNSYGEFQMDYVHRTHLRLYVGVEPRNRNSQSSPTVGETE